jgi:hypothetical protein
VRLAQRVESVDDTPVEPNPDATVWRADRNLSKLDRFFRWCGQPDPLGDLVGARRRPPLVKCVDGGSNAPQYGVKGRAKPDLDSGRRGVYT